MQVLKEYGLGTVIALALLWFVLDKQDDHLGDLGRGIAATQIAIDTHVQQMRLDQAELRFYLRANCRLLARSASDRAECQFTGP